MYVTRRLSHLIQFPNSLSDKPDGPNSGFLVIKDEKSKTYNCFGCKNSYLMNTPLPQNKDLTVSDSDGHKDVVFIPVLNYPLSLNLYYAIKPHGLHEGEAYTCSTDEDKTTCCCFGDCIKDIKLEPFNPQNIYQRHQITCRSPLLCICCSTFYARSVAPNVYPPLFLGFEYGWSVYSRSPKNYQLDDATGLNATLRARLPDFQFPLSYNSSTPIVVGKWYCPFIFIKDGTLKDQMERSMYYEMTLEQKWEKIFSLENDHGTQGNTVTVDVVIQNEVVCVKNREAIWDDKNVVGGAIWFKTCKNGEEVMSVGLSSLIVARMKWEEKRGGWHGGETREVKVKRMEEFGGVNEGGWKKFGCYVLVERFVLKRMDGSIVMTYDFKHIHQVRCKWE